ncbi:MAG: CinA family protein [Proteobacteria bacterium]|nr:CinA family protein [Pseudomonadota bacterium]MDA1355760.1 CinA family protein [Pseudomonadota bacterium]
MNISPSLTARAEQLLAACRDNRIKIATAESCTGGLIAGCLTAVAGSSDVVERGFVTYSNEAKSEMLGVPAELILRVGAVSEEVSRAMAEGALQHSRAQLSVAVTGVAGPGGGTAAKPVGLVHLSCARQGGGTQHERHVYEGDRDAVRWATVETALDMALAAIKAETAIA